MTRGSREMGVWFTGAVRDEQHGIDVGPIRRWFGGHVPPFGSNEFVRFLANGQSMIRYITHHDDIPFHFADYTTACTNGESIWLPRWIFAPDAYKGYAGHRVDLPAHLVATGLFNGFLEHECLHILKSVKDKRIMINEAVSPLAPKSTLLDGCVNLIEDLYIEHDDYDRGPFIGFLNDFLCGEERWGIHTPQRNLKTALFWVNRKNRETFPYDDIADVMGNALTEKDYRTRAQLAKELHDLLYNAEDKDNYYIPAEWDSPGPTPYDRESVRLTDRIEIAARDNPEKRWSDLPEPVERDITVLGSTKNHVASDVRFKPFGRLLRLIKSPKIVPVIPERRGKRLIRTQLHRIATDGNIFNNYDEVPAPEDVEVILLIDASGSMSGIYDEVLSATKGTVESLLECRIACQVYAHTTTSRDNNECLVYVIGRSGDSLDHRFDLATSIGLKQNVDGKAIEYVARKFSLRRGKKLLVVLSDGLPEAPDYGGEEHTKQMIGRVRQQGINVIAVSLDADVFEANDNLYGREFNLKVRDGDFAQALQDMILRFV